MLPPFARSYRRHLLLFLVSVCLVITYHVKKSLFRIRLEDTIAYRLDEIGKRDPDVSCIFPLPHPLDSSILSHVRLPIPIRCSRRWEPYLQLDEAGRLGWNKTALEIGGYRAEDLQCVYSEIWRPPGDDFSASFSDPAELPAGGSARPASDFVYVRCKNWLGFTVYEDYLASVQRIEGIRKYREGELDVLVIGLDSVSRLNFMRQLPKAYRLLVKELDATVLIGFNKVGANTFPNVVPMLTGRPLPPMPHTDFKEWPFIWKDFASAGAITMYAEDQPHINMFDYLSEGIDEQPTHHYLHTFWLAAERSKLSFQSSRLCLGTTPKHQVHFNYIKSFLRTYSDQPKFLFSLLNEPAHNFVNTLGVIDNDFTNFLNSSYHEGLFKRSMVVILGDHGNRLDTIRSTEIGKIEDSMPMVTILLPSWVKSSWRKSLKANSNRLTSTHDLYATFSEVLSTLGGDPGTPGASLDERLLEHFKKPPLGQSLLKEVAKTRSCEEAGIPDWFCVCSQEQETLSVDSPLTTKAALAVVSHINQLLKDFTSLCATLHLNTVVRAFLKKEKNIVILTFSTTPSGALYEATVGLEHDPPKVFDLQRINRYGTQASCLGKEVLSSKAVYKAICYCRGLL